MDLRALVHNPVVWVGAGGGGLVLVLFLSRNKAPTQAAAIPLGAVGQPQPALTGSIPGETAGAAMPAASLTQELSDVATLAGAFQSLQQQLYGMPMADGSGAGLTPPAAWGSPTPVYGTPPPPVPAPAPVQQQIGPPLSPSQQALTGLLAGGATVNDLRSAPGAYAGIPTSESSSALIAQGAAAAQQSGLYPTVDVGSQMQAMAASGYSPSQLAYMTALLQNQANNRAAGLGGPGGGGGFMEVAAGRHLGSALGVAAGGRALTTPWRPTRRELARRGRERHVAAFGGEA